MEAKDWILLVVPIISNGIFVFIFQKIIIVKIEKINQRNAIKNDVYKNFWYKLRELNESFIQANINTQKEPWTIKENLENIKEKILETVKYYDCNEFDLRFLEKLVKKMTKNWDEFQNIYNMYLRTEANFIKVQELGKKLQLVKECVQEMIKKLRKKY